MSYIQYSERGIHVDGIAGEEAWKMEIFSLNLEFITLYGDAIHVPLPIDDAISMAMKGCIYDKG